MQPDREEWCAIEPPERPDTARFEWIVDRLMSVAFVSLAIAFGILCFVLLAPQSKGAEPPRAWTEAPPPAPPAPTVAPCGPEGCRVRGSTFSVVPTPAFGPLPSGYRWQSTVAGHGIVGPSGAWYVEPSPDHTARLNAGYFYTPCPDCNNWPRGYWVSPCVKDENCRVVACNIPPVGQHGEPTAANAEAVAVARGNSFHPNANASGYRRVLTCEGGACLPPVAWAGAAPPQAPAPKQAPACICGDSCACKPGVCPKGCPLSYADAVAKVRAGERVYLSVGKRVERVQVCVGGTCRMVPVAAHVDSLQGFAEGVYECFLLNGSPVMQRR